MPFARNLPSGVRGLALAGLRARALLAGQAQIEPMWKEVAWLSATCSVLAHSRSRRNAAAALRGLGAESSAAAVWAFAWSCWYQRAIDGALAYQAERLDSDWAMRHVALNGALPRGGSILITVHHANQRLGFARLATHGERLGVVANFVPTLVAARDAASGVNGVADGGGLSRLTDGGGLSRLADGVGLSRLADGGGLSRLAEGVGLRGVADVGGQSGLAGLSGLSGQSRLVDAGGQSRRADGGGLSGVAAAGGLSGLSVQSGLTDGGGLSGVADGDGLGGLADGGAHSGVDGGGLGGLADGRRQSGLARGGELGGLADGGGHRRQRELADGGGARNASSEPPRERGWDRQRALSRFSSRVFGPRVYQPSQAARTARAGLDLLAGGGSLILLPDFYEGGAPACILGRRVPLADGVAWFARRSGRPIVPFVVSPTADGWRLWVGQSVAPEPEAIASALEACIRRAPTAWFGWRDWCAAPPWST